MFFFFLTAKVEKEKESQLREMSSDLKIEIQMLKDKFKIMTKERDDLLVTVNQATDIQTTLKQENVDKEEILEIMETEKNKLEKEIGKKAVSVFEYLQSILVVIIVLLRF